MSPAICRQCSYRTLAGVGLTEPPESQPRPWQWAVGVTTAPRAQVTLPQCLDSLGSAGWETLRVFAEPGSSLTCVPSTVATAWRDETLGAFPNWFLGLAELALRAPWADAYFLVQDDVVLAAGLRQYLERSLWPDPSTGVVSVYCPSHYGQRQPPGYHRLDPGWRAWGAAGYVFSNHAARRILQSPRMWDHRRVGPHQGLRNIDSMVGLWCQEQGLGYYVHVPSLAQHIGETSTLYPHAAANGRRCAADFVEDVRLLEQAASPSHRSRTAAGGPPDTPPPAELPEAPPAGLGATVHRAKKTLPDP